MIDVTTLEARCKAAGLRFQKHTDFHLVVRGRYDVNVFPTTGRVYLKGGIRSGKAQSVEEVLEIAQGEISVKVPGLASRRKLTNQKEFLWRNSHICGICRAPIYSFDEATVDHVVPLARGGSNRFDNLQLAHDRCNSIRGASL
jgi:hypothetical protein